MSEYKNPFEEALKNNTEYTNAFEQHVNYDRAKYAQTLATKIENRVNKWLKNNSTFINNAAYRAKTQNGYVSDSGEWLSTITTQKNNFDREAESIKNVLNEYKDVLDPKWIQSISSVFDSNGKTQADIVAGFTEENSYWSQWENEDKYNEWVEWDKEQTRLLNLDVAATRKKADSLQAEVDEYNDLNKQLKSLNRWGNDDDYVMGEVEAEKHQQAVERISKRLAELEPLYLEAAKLRKDATYAEYKQKGEKLKNEALSAPDFETNTAYGKTAAFDRDVVKNFLSLYDFTTNNNPITDPSHEWQGGGTLTDPGNDFFEAMSEEEKKILGYYIETDIWKADEYLHAIKETVGARVANGYAAEADTWYDKLLFSISAGTDQFTSGLSGLVNGIAGKEEYVPPTATQMASGIIRQDIEDSEGFWNGVLGVAYDLGSTSANMLPSILVGIVNPTAGAALMGASAGGNAYNEMINLGYNKNQARAYGVMVGASEALLERFIGGITSLGGGSGALTTKLLSKVDNTFARWAIQTGGSMLSEFAEESLQTVLEPWFKSIVTGLDYEAPNIDEILYSGLLGALSAGLLEGGGNAISAGKTSYKGHQIKKTGGVDALTSYAQTLPSDTEASKLASKVSEKPTAQTVGRLYNSLGEGLTSQNYQTMHDYLVSKGVQYEHASIITDAFGKYVAGEKLSRSERKALTENPLVLQAAKDALGSSVDIDPETGEYVIMPSKLQQQLNANNQAYDDVHEALKSLAKKTAGVVEDTTASQDNAEGVKTVEDEQTVIAEEDATEGNVKADTEAIENASPIKNIASIEDGKITYNLEDGSTSNNATASNDIEALVYESVTEMGATVDSANSILDKVRTDATTLGEQDLRARFFGMKEVYFYGRHGISINEISKHGFADTLTSAEREWAYNLGAKDRVVQTAKKEEAAKSKQKPANRQGINEVLNKDGLYYDKSIKKSSLTSMQKASVDVAKQIHKILGVNVHLFATYVRDGKRYFKDANGVERIGKNNGMYINGDIYLDINAGQNGEGIMLNTLAHELTHHIEEWSPERYKKLCDFLMEQYAEKGVSVSDLVYREIAKAKKNGRDVSFDEAYSDLIANSMETMLHDGTVLNKLAQTDKVLFNKIKAFIDKIVDRIKALYADVEAESLAGKYVASMKDSFTEIQNLFADALIGAGENFKAATESDLVEIDADTESVNPMLSERTWTESEYVLEREKSAEMVAEALGVSKKKAMKYIDDINSIAKMIADARTRLDYEASPFGSAFVSNVEYGGSFDFTTLCKKRRLFTGTFSEIQKKLRNTALTPDDILKIRNMMIERGLEATCGLCYVEGSRANMGKFSQEFIRLYKRDNPNAWIPDMADVNTPDGVESMRINHPEAYEQYEYFWNHYGKLKESDPALFASQQKPKLYEARKEYKGEILKSFSKGETVTKKNLNGGIRMQSFSDFEIIHLIDTMQIIMDMSRVGLAGQAYTKVPEFARAFGNTGLKINLSLIAKGVDADGKLIFDDREGMPHETAFDLRNQYSANVGTIIVTFTDEQLMAAMADDRIDYIIPFHRSQWKKGQYGAMGLPKGTKDYTYMQNEKLIKQTYHEYRGRMVKDKATNYMPNEYWDFSKSGKENAEAYLKMCAENNKRPKFYKLLDYDGKGTYSLKKDGSTDGYWKLLIDFKMYDNNGVGSPQKAVTPNFNMEESTKMLDEYKGGHQSYPVAYDVVDAFVEEYTAGKDKMHFSERDDVYMDAVNRGDIKTAQKMVDEAAKNAGYTRRLYHGTADKFNVFGFGRAGIYTTDNFEMAKTYGENIMSLYGKQGAKVLTIDAQNSPHYAIRVSKDVLDFSEYPLMRGKELYSTNDISRIAFREGYDVVVIKNVYDNFSVTSDNKEKGLGTDVVYKDSNQVKSAEAITYDDNGAVIPLSKRFDLANEDIRYSERDSEGNTLSEGQQQFFKNSKVRDKNGNLLVVYHGTPSGMFYKFDDDKLGSVGGSQHGYGFYFTDSEREAKLYAQGRGNVIKSYINITNPIYATESDLSSNIGLIFDRLPIYAKNNLIEQYGNLSTAKNHYSKYDNGTMLSILCGETGMHPSVFNKTLQNLGYDGIIYSEEGYANEYVVFASNQAKLTTNQNPTENPDIRYSERDYPIDAEVENTVKDAYSKPKGKMHALSEITSEQNKAINRLVNQTHNDLYRGKYEGGKHRFSDTAIRHIIAEHGDFLREGLRAQLPMTLTDIARHLSAIKANKRPSNIMPTKTRRGNPSILTSYEVNGYTLYAEEIKKSLGENLPNDLIGHTMYKAPTLATAAVLTTSARTLPKRQSTVLCEYNTPTSANLSRANFVADETGAPAKLNFVQQNNKPKADLMLSGLIALSSDSSNFTDKSKSIEQGYVMCQKPFYITHDNRVFSNSETNVAEKINELKKQGYDCFIFDKTVGDNYMVAVVNKAQIVEDEPTMVYSERDFSESVLFSERDSYSNGLSEADKETAKKVIDGLKTHAGVAKYGIRSMGAYTDERIDREIRSSSSDTVLDYAKSYITWVEPIDFIYATTTSEQGRDVLREEAGDLDIERLRKETQPIHLTVNFETGEIVGHEGRHRMLALQKAGVDRVAVVIDALNDDRHRTKPIEFKQLKGQNFGQYGRGDGFFLHDVLPLSKRYADVAKKLFSIEPKSGVRFSERDPDYAEQLEEINKTLENENAHLKEDKKNLEELIGIQRKAFRGKEFKKSTVKNAAFFLMKKVNAEGATNELAELLAPYYQSLLDTKTLVWEDVIEGAKPAADWLLKHSSGVLDVEESALKAQDLVREVYSSYWRVSTLNAVDAKIQKRISELKASHKAQMDKAKERREASEQKLREWKREREKAIRKQYQDIVEAHEDKLIAKHQEQRERAKENRTKTEMRHKIKKVVNDLNRLLLHGNKERNVKIGLQPAVAAALEAINFDTVAAEQRLNGYTDENGKYHKGILQKIAEAKAATEPDADVIAGLEKTRDALQAQGDAMNERLETLRKAYSNIQNQKGDFPDYYREEARLIEGKIDSVIEKVGKTPLRFMTLEQLTAVYELYTMVLTTVRDANKVFKQGKAEDLQANASSVMFEVQNVKKLKEERSALGESLRSFMWNEHTPFYAFNRIGSKTLTSFFWELVRGQNVYAQDLAEANSFQEETRKKYGYAKWDTDKVHEFKLEDGRTFKVSLKQMFSIYAYSKRAQALDHMSKGGFFFNDKTTFRKKGKFLEQIKSNEEGYRINETTLKKIKAEMTEEQIKYVDEMQAYLTDMGKKGNEVTRVIWGIDIFKEAVYFPLRSVKDFIYQSNQPAQESSLKNDGMTKETKPHASNPIVLEAFDDVWASHVERMSQYHGFVIPIDNLNKILNYGTWANASSVSVSTMLTARYGSAVNEYLTQFIRDLNGSMSSQGASNPIIGMVSKFKKTAVAASMSTVVQQPTAVLRATGEIDAKYFVGKPDLTKLSSQWETLKKYAPIAIIKEIGGFDAGSGRQATEWLNADTYRGIDKTMKKVDDVSMWLASKADVVGWVAIWDAVKRECVTKYTNLAPNSEEFLKKAGERFTEVIVKTQVYDSTLSRSGYMRSKSDTVKMATAFMGEPTLGINAMFDALVQAKRGTIPKGKAIRTIAANYASMIAASAAASLIYAMRDDDDDESYGEKYMEAFGNKIISDINPLTMLPFVKDIISIFDGWGVERTDMSIVQDIKDAFDALDSDTKSPYRKVEDLAGAIAALFGLPVKNVMRTGREIYTLIEDHFDGINGGDLGDAFISGITGEEKEKSVKLYEAIMDGNEALISQYRSEYKDEASYESAVKKALRENDERITEAAEAYNEGDIRERDRILAEIVAEGYFDEELVAAAIQAEANALEADTEEESETEEEEKATSIYRADDINVALDNGDTELALSIIDDLVQTKVENGMEEDKARSSVKSSVTSYWKPLYKAAYKNKDNEEMKRIRYILFDTGLYGRQSEVVDTCKGWIQELAKEKTK